MREGVLRLIGGAQLRGEVVVPPSKSLSHRVLIAAALSEVPCTVGPIMVSEDIDATRGILEQLGAVLTPVAGKSGYYIVDNPKIREFYTQGGTLCAEGARFQCNESGSTLRFLIPFSFLAPSCTFEGRGRLVERPLTPYYRLFEEKGIAYQTADGLLPLAVDGGFKSGVFSIPGDVSSQFVTGLLMALPLLDGPSEVRVEPPFESKPYVDLTCSVLKAFGIRVENVDDFTYKIGGNQRYCAEKATVEGDYSQAAFWLVAQSLGAAIDVKGIAVDSEQGDRVIVSYIEAFNREERRLDVTDCPDLLPILAVKAALTEGETVLFGGKRVRLKESDRIHAMACELAKLGADVEEVADGLIIRGKQTLTGASVDAWGDHRIAMALAVASLKTEGDVVLSGAEHVKKSYPSFWEVFKQLGGDCR